jgi:hypothetical protein
VTDIYALIDISNQMLEIGRSLLTPLSLYLVAAFRIGVGVVLLLVAADSRAPTALRPTAMPPNPSLNADVPHVWAAPVQRAAGYLFSLGVTRECGTT